MQQEDFGAGGMGRETIQVTNPTLGLRRTIVHRLRIIIGIGCVMICSSRGLGKGAFADVRIPHEKGHVLADFETPDKDKIVPGIFFFHMLIEVGVSQNTYSGMTHKWGGHRERDIDRLQHAPRTDGYTPLVAGL
jgi:hypothetical protein